MRCQWSQDGPVPPAAVVQWSRQTSPQTPTPQPPARTEEPRHQGARERAVSSGTPHMKQPPHTGRARPEPRAGPESANRHRKEEPALSEAASHGNTPRGPRARSGGGDADAQPAAPPRCPRDDDVVHMARIRDLPQPSGRDEQKRDQAAVCDAIVEATSNHKLPLINDSQQCCADGADDDDEQSHTTRNGRDGLRTHTGRGLIPEVKPRTLQNSQFG
jgi:hypothetical protein